MLSVSLFQGKEVVPYQPVSETLANTIISLMKSNLYMYCDGRTRNSSDGNLRDLGKSYFLPVTKHHRINTYPKFQMKEFEKLLYVDGVNNKRSLFFPFIE